MSQRLSNFSQPGSLLKKPLKDRLKKKELAQHDRPGNSEAHLKCVRVLNCATCLAFAPSDPHHLKHGVQHERGIGRRATDRWTVPLCRSCHDSVESVGSRREPEWFAKRGIADPLGLASALWNATGNPVAMNKIVDAHRGHKTNPVSTEGNS